MYFGRSVMCLLSRLLHLGFLARVESWCSPCCDRQAAYVFQIHTGTQRVQGLVLNYPVGALNTTDERFGTERSTRADAYTSFEGWEEGCGMYKADCLSCIPSRLLGILSPYPLHALSRRFSPSRVLLFSLFLSLVRNLPSLFLCLSCHSCAVYRGEQYSSHLNILRAVSRVAIRMFRRCCRKS